MFIDIWASIFSFLFILGLILSIIACFWIGMKRDEKKSEKQEKNIEKKKENIKEP